MDTYFREPSVFYYEIPKRVWTQFIKTFKSYCTFNFYVFIHYTVQDKLIIIYQNFNYSRSESCSLQKCGNVGNTLFFFNLCGGTSGTAATAGL
jgi:hypothetical protein